MRIILTVFYIALVLFGVSFALLNASLIKINLFVTYFKLPLSLLVLILIALGVFIGLLLSLIWYLRLSSEHRKIKKRLDLTEQEIKNLRAIPLQDQH